MSSGADAVIIGSGPNGLAAAVEAHDSQIVTDTPVRSWADLPPAPAYLFDTTPQTLLRVVGDRLPTATARTLRRFRHGDAAAKVDYVLSGPVPWTAPDVARAGTVHLGGTRRQLAATEADVAATSPGTPSACGSYSPGRRRARTRIPPGSTGCTCAPPRHHPGRECTASAG